MSVTAYPMTSTGFIIDEKAAAYINLAYNEKHNSVPDDIQKMLYDNRFNDLAKKGELPYEYNDITYAHEVIEDFDHYHSDFDGCVKTIFPEKTNNPLVSFYESDILCFVPLSKQPEYLAAAYESHNEILSEIKEHFRAASINFPDDFDWWRRIVNIYGIYYC